MIYFRKEKCSIAYKYTFRFSAENLVYKYPEFAKGHKAIKFLPYLANHF